VRVPSAVGAKLPIADYLLSALRGKADSPGVRGTKDRNDDRRFFFSIIANDVAELRGFPHANRGEIVETAVERCLL
jgi:hypothetical protein